MLSWHFIEYPTLGLKKIVAPKLPVVTPGIDTEPQAPASPEVAPGLAPSI
jgi:hypothetical protein